MTEINIANFSKKVKLPKSKILKLAKSIINEEKLNFSTLNIIFVDDKTIHEINKKFLNHDYPTDVISFDLSDDFDDEKISEIYISVDRAIEQAKVYKVTTENEIARLVAHGLLHLAGYNDSTKSEKLKMRRKESYYIKMAGF
ncbi:rRNA maturation RNase YbeY [Candidatus Chrysopegis kryptomonas]|uniref:Endoribonuclease YbeY n=1 Tax=Candidatus Chryseopegocella kryptomonas TaxID=1633643 RepID=A0A0P1NT21_9BACT|nr:rRNA maturation RNase YbeY [Candidatus Chrysopegis kryptomonas]CUT02127.1 rRNA maturation RNase YbeY [Candidatus Chrysopegis kryptomonas]